MPDPMDATWQRTADQIAAEFTGSTVTHYGRMFRADYMGRAFEAETPEGMRAQLRLVRERDQAESLRCGNPHF